jgi:PAS domain S-box-containing protein
MRDERSTATHLSSRGVVGGSYDGVVHPVVAALHDVFAGVPHTMFCVKDVDGRYIAVNQAFAERAGRSVEAVLGSSAADLFPADLAESYEAQDRRVLATREAIRNELELILRPDGSRGWYVSTKTLLVDERGGPIGLASVSYDLRSSTAPDDRHQRLQAAIDLARRRFAEPVKVVELAEAAGLSLAQLDRALRRTIGLSPKQLLLRARLDEAMRRLDDTDLPIATIASECGYYDQSSFTRQFRRATGLTPAAYRSAANELRSPRMR